MLRRKFTDRLIKWKSDPHKKCLLVKGARQVGKTFTIDDFGKTHYKNYLYINFETSPDKRAIFEGDLDMETLIIKLTSRFTNFRFESGNTLIFLDEIQSCPGARVALKSFALDKRFDVIASGSLLGLNYKEVSSYPVGYEEPVDMHSLDFEEFLWAIGLDADVISYVSEKIENKEALDPYVLDTVDEYFQWYTVVGGMPEVVNAFADTKDMGRVLRVQRKIISNYMSDISKYAPQPDKTKAKNCLRSVPAQLSKANKKFVYFDIENKSNGGSRRYDSSLSWLYDAGIINYCYNLQEPVLPLATKIKMDSFKIYMRDTGLLVSMMEDGTSASLLLGDTLINKGAVAENIIADVLGKKDLMLMYFEKKGDLEVDFILNTGVATAVEVKSGNNKKSKSMASVMSDRYKVERGIKLEKTNIYIDENNVEHYPLFAATFLFRERSDGRSFPSVESIAAAMSEAKELRPPHDQKL